MLNVLVLAERLGDNRPWGGQFFISQLEWTALNRQYSSNCLKQQSYAPICFLGFLWCCKRKWRIYYARSARLVSYFPQPFFWLVNFVLSLPTLSALVSKVSFELTGDELKRLLPEPTSPCWLDRRGPPCLALGVFWVRMSLCSPGWTQPWSNWFTRLCLPNAGIKGVHPPTFWFFFRGRVVLRHGFSM